MRKLKDILRLIKAKHYAVLIGDSEMEISWAIEVIGKADKAYPADLQTPQEMRAKELALKLELSEAARKLEVEKEKNEGAQS